VELWFGSLKGKGMLYARARDVPAPWGWFVTSPTVRSGGDGVVTWPKRVIREPYNPLAASWPLPVIDWADLPAGRAVSRFVAYLGPAKNRPRNNKYLWGDSDNDEIQLPSSNHPFCYSEDSVLPLLADLEGRLVLLPTEEPLARLASTD